MAEVWFSYSEDHYAYIEEYEDINLIKARINELNYEWKQRVFIKNYLMIALRNRWEDEIFIGIYNSVKWYASSLSVHSLECLNNERPRELKFQRQKIIDFCMPSEIVCSFTDLIQKNTALKIIKEWLDTGTYTQYFFGESGVETRKYVPPIPIPIQEIYELPSE